MGRMVQVQITKTDKFCMLGTLVPDPANAPFTPRPLPSSFRTTPKKTFEAQHVDEERHDDCCEGGSCCGGEEGDQGCGCSQENPSKEAEKAGEGSALMVIGLALLASLPLVLKAVSTWRRI